jgi:hypothetical protein
MLKVLKFAALLLILAVGVVLLVASQKPDYFRVERTVNIQAPAEKIFPYVNTHKKWTEWSPWEQLDPNMERTYSGPDSGVGAKYAWRGNKNIGEGSTTITESVPDSKIVSSLDFIKPMEGHNTVEFTFQPREDSTDVTWAMHGPQPFVGKIMSVFMNCDKMIGEAFENGLHNLKNIAEAQA